MSEGQAVKTKKSRAKQAILILVLICLGSGAGVGIVYWLMRDEMEAKARGAFHSALAAVLGEAESYPVVGEYPDGTNEEDKVYVNEGASGVLYAARGEAQGYQSRVKVLVSVEVPEPNTPVGRDAAIHALVVGDSNETPGLGENIKAVAKSESLWAKLAGMEPEDAGAPARPWFQGQFTGKRLDDLVVVKAKRTDKIAAVTGATITSEAVTKAARNAIERIIAKTTEANGK